MDVIIRGELNKIIVSTEFLEMTYKYTGKSGEHHFQATPNHNVESVLAKIHNMFGKVYVIREALDELLAMEGIQKSIW